MRLQTGMWLMLCALAASGCGHVERQIVIQTDPTGAPAWVDEEYVGLTPATYRFEHYGIRRIRVGPIREAVERPAGAQPETALAEGEKPVPPDDSGPILYNATERMLVVEAPPYEAFPIDFLYEVILPTRLVDRHEVTIRLDPATEWPAETGRKAAEDVVKEADAFRQKALAPLMEGEE